MQIKLNLIAAACENMGIGINGDLPWRLRKEMAYFTEMTTKTKDVNRQNLVLMGRKTWDGIPKKYKPLSDRINMVLTSQTLDLGEGIITSKSLTEAMDKITQTPLKDQVEKIWVIGGSSVYQAAMESPYFHRLYLTRIKKNFECDTFFPPLPKDFVLVKDPEVPEEVQEEKEIQFVYEIYERSKN